MENSAGSGVSFMNKIADIISEPDVDKLLSLVMSAVIEISGAKRGFLVLLSENGGIEFKVAHNIDLGDIPSPQFEISRTILADVLKSGEPICVPNAKESPKYKEQASILRMSVLSVLAVPLKVGNKVVGAVYLDNTKLSGIFDEAKTSLVMSFAGKIACVVANASTAEQLRKRNRELLRLLREKHRFDNIVCVSPKMLAVLEKVSKVADSRAPILITGESGTGKELIARAIHYNSSRAEKNFVPVNCGAIPFTLVESELFGHIAGAFTGATTTRAGRFEAADGGTIFLDEIGELTPEVQVKLLRVLQEGEIQKVGSDSLKKVDVRVISASNRDISALVKEGKFRQDLYYRLNVVEIEVPPLREHREDILVLIEHITKRLAKEYHKDKIEVDPVARALLIRYDYPGNVRELENILERAVMLSGGKIGPEHLPGPLAKTLEIKTAVGIPRTLEELNAAKEQARETVERLFIMEALRGCKGNVSEAARQTGINRSQLQQLISKYEIDTAAFNKQC